MDLVALWGKVPPLLDACLDSASAAVRTLRLVNKEASKVALFALRSYTLTLTKCKEYNPLWIARLLTVTKLQELRVLLHSTG